MKSFTTGRATSASSRATRTSRSAADTSASLSAPRRVSLSKTPESRSCRLSNIAVSRSYSSLRSPAPPAQRFSRQCAILADLRGRPEDRGLEPVASPWLKGPAIRGPPPAGQIVWAAGPPPGVSLSKTPESRSCRLSNIAVSRSYSSLRSPAPPAQRFSRQCAILADWRGRPEDRGLEPVTSPWLNGAELRGARLSGQVVWREGPRPGRPDGTTNENGRPSWPGGEAPQTKTAALPGRPDRKAFRSLRQ